MSHFITLTAIKSHACVIYCLGNFSDNDMGMYYLLVLGSLASTRAFGQCWATILNICKLYVSLSCEMYMDCELMYFVRGKTHPREHIGFIQEDF